MPFDFSTVIANIDGGNVGVFPRHVLPALSSLDDDGNSIQYLVEWSPDGGLTWNKLNGFPLRLLDDEFGIYITQPNLSEIAPDVTPDATIGADGLFTDSTFTTEDSVEINFWTSLANDKENNTYPAWLTKVRITAGVQLDDRMVNELDSFDESGAPLVQFEIFDAADKYQSRIREGASQFGADANYPLPWWSDQKAASQAQTESLEAGGLMALQHAAIDRLNRQAGFSGSYELAQIHLAEGSEPWRMPRFNLGDCIEGIAGRNISCQTVRGELGANARYAVLEQIVFRPQAAQTTLVTADLRKSFRR